MFYTIERVREINDEYTVCRKRDGLGFCMRCGGRRRGREREAENWEMAGTMVSGVRLTEETPRLCCDTWSPAEDEGMRN